MTVSDIVIFSLFLLPLILGSISVGREWLGIAPSAGRSPWARGSSAALLSGWAIVISVMVRVPDTSLLGLSEGATDRLATAFIAVAFVFILATLTTSIFGRPKALIPPDRRD
jgi:hypothetical protein